MPRQNYGGWWLTAFFPFWLFLSVAPLQRERNPSSDPFNQLAIWSYATLGLRSVIVDFEFGLHGPGLVGVFAMLPWVVLGWISTRRASSQ